MRITRIGVPLAALVVAGCTPTPPPADGGGETPPSQQPRSEFGASHHAIVEGVVTGRGGQPLDSITVVAWRLTGGVMLAQSNAVTDAQGRFRLGLYATVGPQPTPHTDRAVIRGFAWASRYPRGAEGRVALDSTTVNVTLVPTSQPPPVVQARITLPLP
jgi:hypothetical protein